MLCCCYIANYITNFESYVKKHDGPYKESCPHNSGQRCTTNTSHTTYSHNGLISIEIWHVMCCPYKTHCDLTVLSLSFHLNIAQYSTLHKPPASNILLVCERIYHDTYFISWRVRRCTGVCQSLACLSTEFLEFRDRCKLRKLRSNEQ